MSPAAGQQLAPSVLVAGTPLTAVQLAALVDLRVELEFRVPSRCTLRFADPHYALASSSTFALGAKVQVQARGSDPLLVGQITSVAVDQRPETTPELVVVAHDAAYRLARHSTITTYLKMTYADVVRAIASRNGLRADAASTGDTVEYLLQADSDLALLDALADRVGFDWWVSDGVLHFKRPSAGGSPIELELGKDLRAFSVRSTGLNPDTFVVNGWDRTRKAPVTGEAGLAGAPLAPSSAFAAQGLRPAKSLGGGEVTTSTTSVSAMTTGEAQQLSEAMRDRAAAAAATARGTLSGDARIIPGVTLRVSGSGPVSGDYHVSRVEHLYRASGFETRFVAGDRRPTSLVDTLAPRSGGAGPLLRDGLVVGVVTNINDPDKRGRVKIHYPGLSKDEESAWARILTIGAGDKRGMVFLPEVNDEVLVGFEGGDLRQPVVLGGLYSDKASMADWDVKDGQIAARRITSRLGHFIELADGADESTQHLLLQLAGKKTKLRLGKDKVDLEVPAGVPLRIAVGSSLLKFADNGDITITGPNITIKAEQNLSLEGTVKTSVKGAQVQVEGSASAAVKSPKTDVEGSGMLGLKGGMVMIN